MDVQALKKEFFTHVENAQTLRAVLSILETRFYEDVQFSDDSFKVSEHIARMLKTRVLIKAAEKRMVEIRKMVSSDKLKSWRSEYKELQRKRKGI